MDKSAQLPEIIERVTGVTWQQITQASRGKENIAIARQLYAYICRHHLHQNLRTVGEMINRDHTTIIHAVRTVAHRLYVHDDLYEPVYKQIMIELNKTTSAS